MSMSSVQNPYQIPSSIDNVNSDQAAVQAINDLRFFLQDLLVQDKSSAYWGFNIASIAIVAVCTVLGLCMLMACGIKGNVQLFKWLPIFNGKIHIVLPCYVSVLYFSLFLTGLWYIIFAVHRMELDDYLVASELQGAAFLFGWFLWLPLWIAMFLETTRHVSKALPVLAFKSSQAARQKALVALRVTGIAVVAASTLGPSIATQHKLNELLPTFGKYLDVFQESVQWYNRTTESYEAIGLLRRYESVTIGVWKSYASVMNGLLPVFILWSIFYGALLVANFIAITYSRRVVNNGAVDDTEDLIESKAKGSAMSQMGCFTRLGLALQTHAIIAETVVVFAMFVCVMSVAIGLNSSLDHATFTSKVVGNNLAFMGTALILVGLYCIALISFTLRRAVKGSNSAGDEQGAGKEDMSMLRLSGATLKAGHTHDEEQQRSRPSNSRRTTGLSTLSDDSAKTIVA